MLSLPMRENVIDELKALLRRDLSVFCGQSDRRWKAGILEVLREIRTNQWTAVFFGGTLRSLLLSRLMHNRIGRPRDIDIVIRGVALQELEREFKPYISRQTRFGGIQLRRVDWTFDVWPLEQTSTLSRGEGVRVEFSDLPSSTFLNLEAIAADVWPGAGRPRRLYSGDDQFFDGIISRVVEVNLEENPFPELCVVRSLVIAGNLQWKVGPKLLHYIAKYGAPMSELDLDDVQRKHYGAIEWPGAVLRRVVEAVSREVERSPVEPTELPLPKQLRLWSEKDGQWPYLRIRVVK